MSAKTEAAAGRIHARSGGIPTFGLEQRIDVDVGASHLIPTLSLHPHAPLNCYILREAPWRRIRRAA